MIKCVLKAGSPFIKADGHFCIATKDIPTTLKAADKDGKASVTLHLDKGDTEGECNQDHLRPVLEV